MKEMLFRTIRRYNVETKYRPDIVIESSKESLFQDIFRMANILNELSSLKLLIMPTSFNLFQRIVETYFNSNRIKFSLNPKIKVKIQRKSYSFSLDFLFNEKKTYTKIITSDSIVKDWAVNFDQIKKHSKKNIFSLLTFAVEFIFYLLVSNNSLLFLKFLPHSLPLNSQ